MSATETFCEEARAVAAAKKKTLATVKKMSFSIIYDKSIESNKSGHEKREP